MSVRNICRVVQLRHVGRGDGDDDDATTAVGTTFCVRLRSDATVDLTVNLEFCCCCCCRVFCASVAVLDVDADDGLAFDGADRLNRTADG